ncbi:MAG: AAA-like domain-containing protein, partial [Xenococcus sp. (in: cyanobacteria)]
LEDFKATASTEESIYRPYLRKLLMDFKLNCQSNPQLQETMIKVLQEKKAIQVEDYNLSDRLYHMGLISFEGNKVKLRYEIYRDYLTTHLQELS